VDWTLLATMVGLGFTILAGLWKIVRAISRLEMKVDLMWQHLFPSADDEPLAHPRRRRND
jgi:RsiW-degrading membrane proteinase PrsW (M82 family)